MSDHPHDPTPARDPETPLQARLKRLIAATGPVSLADYMLHCLSDPEHGYYTSRTPLGAKGDFITAPEISQLFGELIGIWMLAVWQQSGCPTPFHLVELGPGRGTLMRDMLRALSSDPAATKALHIHLVDISSGLKDLQKGALSDTQCPVDWHDGIDGLPAAPLFIVANEFFDCLPIHQWVMHEGNWHERVVGLDESGDLAFGLGPVRAMTAPSEQDTIAAGTIFEQSPASEAIIALLTRHLGQYGGAGLFIDYGYTEPGFGDTFQALHRHRFANPLAAPGHQDLTAHVNFAALARCARNALQANTQTNPGNNHPMTIHTPVTQGDFLLAMGLLQRAGQLGAGKSHAQQQALRDAVERLASPDHMGELFKIFAILPHHVTLPPFLQA